MENSRRDIETEAGLRPDVCKDVLVHSPLNVKEETFQFPPLALLCFLNSINPYPANVENTVSSQ